MSTYGDFRKGISPAWLQARYGAAWADALGGLQDFLSDATKQAVKARMPLLAPPDALEQIGVERGLPRGPNESNAAYAGRLRAAWDTWRYAGTAFGLLSALSAAGYIGAELRIQNAVRYYLDAAGRLVVEQRAAGEWWIDGNAAFWSRFVVLLKPPFPFPQFGPVTHTGGTGPDLTVTGLSPGSHSFDVQAISGSGSPVAIGAGAFHWREDGGAWSGAVSTSTGPVQLGTTGVFVQWGAGSVVVNEQWSFNSLAPPADGSDYQRQVSALVAKWKPAHATCTDVFVIPSGRTWDSYPTGATWDAQQRATWDSDTATVTHWSP